MKNIFIFIIFIFVLACNSSQHDNAVQKATIQEQKTKAEYALVIHGGAGTVRKENITPQQEKDITAVLNAALDIGEKILAEGGSSVDAVVATIAHLEDSPFFNAGKGAVFTHDGKNELDASIMNGADQNAGAVGGITTVKNPIKAARAVMEHSKHVLLTNTGAEIFAKEQGLETVSPEYFHTEDRKKSLQRAKERENKSGYIDTGPDFKYGTVGAAALDKNGNLAAGTSTGGMTNKKYNRLGDSPIIGAGTYADNATCAISCTGHGEYFIRYAVAYDVSARMAYKNESLDAAAQFIINDKLIEKGGAGGLIGVDAKGNITMPFNTPGMYRGYTKPGERKVLMFK